MWNKKKPEGVNEIIEQPAVVPEKKKPFATLFKGKDNGITAVDLIQNKVREYDGPFKHKVTGKEFNSFVVETQNAIIQMKQEMLTFTGRVDNIGSDLDKVDKRHNEISEATIQALKQNVNDMQLMISQQEEMYKKSFRIYQIIAAVAVLTAIASLVLFLLK